MKILNIIFFSFVFVAQGCMESNDSGFHFDEDTELIGKALPIVDSVSLRYPFRIRQKDSSFYVLDLHGYDFYCHKLSYPSMSFIESYAHRGNGPDDFLSVENIRLNKKGDLYFLDANREAIIIYDNNIDKAYKRIRLSEKLIRSLDFALLDDSLFVVTDYTGKYRINIVNAMGRIQNQLFKIPTKRKDPNVSDIALAQAWRSFIDYNPDNGVLGIVTQLGQVIEIYNLKTNKTVNILYGKFGEPEFINQGSFAVPNGIMGYSDIQVGKDKIYTVFWGHSFKDIRKNQTTIEGGNIIQVFSLEGKPICQYLLDKHITGFSVNEENNKLLGLDVNNEQQVVEYQL